MPGGARRGARLARSTKARSRSAAEGGCMTLDNHGRQGSLLPGQVCLTRTILDP